MAKQIEIRLVLDVSKEIFNEFSQGLTDSEKKDLEGINVPSTGLCLWNDKFVKLMRENIIPKGKPFLDKLLQDLEENDRTRH